MTTAAPSPIARSAPPGREWWRPLRPALPAEASPLAFKGLLAFLFVLMLAPQSLFPALAPLRPALLAAGIAIGGFLLDRLLRGRPLSIVTREMGAAAALALWAVATLPLSDWPGGSLSFLLDTYFKTLAIFWLIPNVVDRLDRLRWSAAWLSLLGLPLALTAVKNFATGTYDPHLLAEGVTRIAGYTSALAENPNDLALMLNLLIPVSAALLLTSRRLWLRALLAAQIAVSAAGVIVTFSRAGFLTLAVIAAVYSWRLLGRGRALGVAALSAAAVAAFTMLPAGYLGRLGTIGNIEADPTGSAQDRWADGVAAVRYLVAHPLLGSGVGMNMLALNEQRGEAWKEVHNVFLEYGVELGLPGLGLFLLLYGWSFATARRARRAALRWGRRDLAALAEGIEVALAAFAVAALFHPVAYHFYFYLFAGLAVAAGRIARQRAWEGLAAVPARPRA